MPHRALLPLLSLIAAAAPFVARAADSGSAELALFDRPAAVQTVPPKTENDPVGEIRCTYYRDFMVRETGTDSPAPGPAVLLPVADAAHRPPCNDAPAARQVPLNTEEDALLGRKGPFLVFDAADPYGAVPFVVIDSGSGRVLFTDGKTPDGLRALRLEAGTLHLGYTRAFNGACSIPRDGAGCWAKLVQDAKLPPALAQTPPPVEACAAAYRKAEAPPEGPSMISYDVDVSLDTAGKAQVTPRGAVKCEPLP